MPPTHPLFVEQSIAELRLEMFEDTLVQREKILDKLKSATGAERIELRDRLSEINKMFEYEADQGEDDLIDEWENDLAEGRIPDLNKR